jgi:hypothetical protein
MIFRLSGHLNLVGHFLVLAALYLCLRPTRERQAELWLCLLAVAALVNAYLLVMVMVLWLADLTTLILGKARPLRYAGCEFLGVALIVGLVCWQSGYFTVGNAAKWGYGFYRMNLLSIVDPSGWSYVLKDIPQADGDYEGFNFLGLGSILAVIFAAPVILQKWGDVLRFGLNRWVFLVTLLGLTAFALTNNLGIGSTSVEFLHGRGHAVLDVFRASGRMFWPVFYALLLAATCIIILGYRTPVAACLLAFALVVQVADTSAGWEGIRRKLMAEPAAEWATPLKDPFWNQAAAKYRRLRWVMPQNQSPYWQTFASYAARHGLATDAIYLARVGQRQLDYAREKARVALTTGNFDGDSLYILDAESLVEAVGHLDRSADLLARIDGFNVLAPGWKKCRDCRSVVDDISPMNQ